MTRRTNAKLAGYAFLAYIILGLGCLFLFSRATAGAGVEQRLQSVALHATSLRWTVPLGFLANLSALILAVTLYALTRGQDPDLAMLALTCRVAEGIVCMDVSKTLGLLWLATAGPGGGVDAGAGATLAAYFLKMDGGFNASATFFALGSTLFAWLLLRGRMIPAALAWLGLVASVLLVLCQPLLLAGLLGGPISGLVWLPMLVFEVVLGFLLIVKGVQPGSSALHQDAVIQ